MVIPSVKKEELATLFPAGVETKTLPSGKEYLRFTPDPSKTAKK
jgi:1-Cys peroxiredoxin 6